MRIFPNTFYDCHFSTSNQIENGTIDHIFKIYLVISSVQLIKQFCRNQLLWTVDCFKTVFRYRSEKCKIYKSCACYLSTFLSKNRSVAILVLKYVSPKYTFFGPRSKPGPQPDTASYVKMYKFGIQKSFVT